MEDMKKNFPSLPTNYVTLQQLHEQRLKEQQQRLREKEEEEERKLQEEKLKEEQLIQKQKEEEEKEERKHQDSSKARRSRPYRNRRFLEKNRHLPKKEGEITLKEQISKQLREKEEEEDRKLQEEKLKEEQLNQKQKEEEETEERKRQESIKYGENKAKHDRPNQNRRLLEKNRHLEPKKGKIALKEQTSNNMKWKLVKKIPMMKETLAETLEKSPPVNREKIKSPVTSIRGEGIQRIYRKRNENPPESNSVAEEKTVSMNQTVEIVQKIGDLTVDDDHKVVEKMDGEDKEYKDRSTGQIVNAGYPKVRIRGRFDNRRSAPPPEPSNSGQKWVRKEEVPEPVPTISRFSRAPRFGSRPV